MNSSKFLTKIEHPSFDTELDKVYNILVKLVAANLLPLYFFLKWA